jgi:hypothetical protein
MRKTLFAALLAIPMFASAAVNELANGSFESGLAGWTVVNGGGIAVSTITYSVAGPFGTVVAPDNAPSLSPDAVGTMAAYFVDDVATQSISQTITLAAGSYNIGVNLLAPANGLANPLNSTFSISFDGIATPAVPVSPILGSDTWNFLIGTTAALPGGSYTFTVSFTGGGVTANDLVIDRAYVSAVPESETYALMLAGLVGLTFTARRRHHG